MILTIVVGTCLKDLFCIRHSWNMCSLKQLFTNQFSLPKFFVRRHNGQFSPSSSSSEIKWAFREFFKYLHCIAPIEWLPMPISTSSTIFKEITLLGFFKLDFFVVIFGPCGKPKIYKLSSISTNHKIAYQLKLITCLSREL